MAKLDEYIAIIRTLSEASNIISNEQRIGLLRQAVNNFGLSVEEATDILKSFGLVVDNHVNHFDVLGIEIDEIQRMDELSIKSRVETAHKRLYNASLAAGGRPRTDGKTEEQWRTLLNQARDTLNNEQKRQEHIAMLQHDDLYATESISTSETIPSETESIPLRTLEQDSMILIPAGEFEMGCDDYDIPDEEKPAHSVYVDAFHIDKYPVTNSQYKEFIDANPQWRNLGWFDYHHIFKLRDSDYLLNWFKGNYPTGKADHPVNWISWHAAMAYANWVGKRLPTEAEWEKAARGGLTRQKYPWGQIVNDSYANYDKRVAETTPVGKYPENGYGLGDIVGNISEWCLDQWDSKFYEYSERRNPVSGSSIEGIIDTATKSKTLRVIRGGSWYSSEQDLRVSNRDRLASWKTSSLVGFRCVRSVDT